MGRQETLPVIAGVDRPLVRVNQTPGCGLAPPHRRQQRLHDQFGIGPITHLPADDLPGKQVEHNGQALLILESRTPRSHDATRPSGAEPRRSGPTRHAARRQACRICAARHTGCRGDTQSLGDFQHLEAAIDHLPDRIELERIRIPPAAHGPSESAIFHWHEMSRKLWAYQQTIQSLILDIFSEAP